MVKQRWPVCARRADTPPVSGKTVVTAVDSAIEGKKVQNGLLFAQRRHSARCAPPLPRRGRLAGLATPGGGAWVGGRRARHATEAHATSAQVLSSLGSTIFTAARPWPCAPDGRRQRVARAGRLTVYRVRSAWQSPPPPGPAAGAACGALGGARRHTSARHGSGAPRATPPVYAHRARPQSAERTLSAFC